MIFLIDHNLERQAAILLGNIASQGWLDLIPIRFVTFKQISLPVDSNDRIVWRFAQENRMILLTANRNMKDDESLEQVMRQENTRLFWFLCGNRSRGGRIEFAPRQSKSAYAD